MTDAFYGTFGWAALKSLEPKRLMVRVSVDFDYNAFTFVITKPMEIAPVSQAGSSTQVIHSLYDEALAFPRPDNVPARVEFAAVIAAVECLRHGGQALVLTNMIPNRGDDAVDKIPFLALQEKLRSQVTLTSKKRQRWLPLKQANLRKQANALRRADCFGLWLQNVFRLHSSQHALDLSQHAVVVHVKEGFGLGEIESLEKFERMTSKKALKLLQRNVSVAAKGANKMDDNEDFSPRQFTKDSVASIVFMGKSDGMCQVVHVDRDDLATADGDNDTATDPDACAATARSAFAEMCRVSLPNVTTPPLNE